LNIWVQASNELLEAKATGESEGLRYAHSMDSFEQVLNSTIENPDARIELYRFLSQQEATNEQLASTTRNLGQGTAQLYLTPESVNLNLAQATVTPNGATSSVLLPTTGPGSASTDWQASSGA